MQRKTFLTSVSATVAFVVAFSCFSFKSSTLLQGATEKTTNKINKLTVNNQDTNNTNKNMAQELATFGAVHLNVTNLERSVSFWKDYIGMKVRNTTAEYTEMGTDKNTLVVLYPTANTGFIKATAVSTTWLYIHQLKENLQGCWQD